MATVCMSPISPIGPNPFHQYAFHTSKPQASTSTSPALDAAWYPHIIDAVIDFSCDPSLPLPLSLRGVSREWRDRIDRAVAQRQVIAPSANQAGIEISVVPGFSGLSSSRPFFTATAQHAGSPDADAADRLLSLARIVDIAGTVHPSTLSSLIRGATKLDTLRIRANALGDLPLAPFAPRTLVVWHDPSQLAIENPFAPPPVAGSVQKEALIVPYGSVLETLTFCSARLRNTPARELVLHFGRWDNRFLQGEALTSLQCGLASIAKRRTEVSITVVGLDAERAASRCASPVPEVADEPSAKRETSDSDDDSIEFTSIDDYAAAIGQHAFRLETFL